MNALRRWTNDRVISTVARAAAAGHDCNELVRRHSAPGQSGGVVCTCTCGWESTPRGRVLVAAIAGLWHAMEVCAVLDERLVLDHVEWSAAPASPRLMHDMREFLDDADKAS